MASYFLYLDKKDMAQVLKDLDRLGDDFKVKRKAVRRALKQAGKPVEIGVKKRAEIAIDDVSEIANSFSWNTRVKRNVLYVWFQSMVKKGGYLTKIFEDGTVDRFTKRGWWTGRIIEGGKNKIVRTKFIQQGFDANKKAVENSIVKYITITVDRIVKKSKKLNKVR